MRRGVVTNQPKAAACKRAGGGEKGGDKLSNGRREFNSNVQFKTPSDATSSHAANGVCPLDFI